MKKMALIMAMAVLVCWLPGQALADIIIMWDLSGVTFSGGGSATGDFTYDATTGTITSWDITANQGTSHSAGTTNPYTFPASASASAANQLPGTLVYLTELSAYPGYGLFLYSASGFSDLAAPGSLTLSGTSYYEVFASSSSIKNYTLTGGSLTGTEVSAVPLPSTGLLLGFGLLGLALLGLRRKGTAFQL